MKRRQFTTLALLALAAACRSDYTTSPLMEFAGVYVLDKINGAPLPVTLGPTQAGTVAVVSSRVTLSANATFTAQFVTRETIGTSSTTTTDASAGTWTRTGSTLSLRDSVDGSTTTAQYAAGSITIIDAGFTMVYQRIYPL